MGHRTHFYFLRGGSLHEGQAPTWAAHCDCGEWAVDFKSEKAARAGCEAHKRTERKARARANRKAREQAMRDAGLRKVRGARGGTYWE